MLLAEIVSRLLGVIDGYIQMLHTHTKKEYIQKQSWINPAILKQWTSEHHLMGFVI